MFCTRCGKKLNDDDIFCSNCGYRVKPEPSAETDRRYADVVFNPPFKLEAERRTEEISKELERQDRRPQKEKLTFDWDLDSFPTEKHSKKDDDFTFNWDDVVEKRHTRQIDVEKIEPPEEARQEERKNPNDIPPSNIKANTSGALSIEDLEKELFGSAPENVSPQAEKELEMTLQYKREDFKREEDKFYTYNAKRDAFQELIDRERQRIAEMEKKREDQWGTIAGQSENLHGHGEPPAFEDIFKEPEIFTDDYRKEESVILPPKTGTVDLSDVEEAAADAGADLAGAEPTSGDSDVAEAEPTSGDSNVAEAEPSAGDSDVAGTELPAGEDISRDEDAAPMTDDSAAGKPSSEESEPAAEEPERTEGEASSEEDGDTINEAAFMAAAAAGLAAEEAKEAEGEEPPFQAGSEQPGPEQAGSEQPDPGQDSPIQADHQKKTKLRYSDVFPYDHSDLDRGADSAQSSDAPEVGGNASASSDAAAEAGGSGAESKEENADVTEKSGIAHAAESARNDSDARADESAGTDKTDGADGDAHDGGKARGRAAAFAEDDDDDEHDRKKKKKKGFRHGVIKAAIIILSVLIVCEVAIIGAKLIAPDSAFSRKVDQILVSVGNLLSGGEDEPEQTGGTEEEVPQVSDITQYINDVSGGASSIGQIAEAADLKYDLSQTYSFEGIKDSKDFDNGVWKKDGGEELTYGRGIVESIVKYYDGLKPEELGEDIVGINKLEIGEIRTGDEGFYALCRITVISGENKEAVKRQSVYLKDSGDSISVEDVKEETV